jgi:hypothetical protein
MLAQGELPPSYDRAGVNREPPRPPLSQLFDRGSDSTRKPARRVDVLLATARTRQGAGDAGPLRVGLGGNVLTAAASTSAVDTCEIRLNGEGDFIPWGVGATLHGAAFDFFEVINPAQVGATMSFVAFTDAPGDRVLFRIRD